MSAASFDTPATEVGIPEDIIKHEIVGDDISAEQVVEANPMTTVDENGDNEDLDFLYEKDSSDEDEAVVTIGDIRKNLPFQKNSIANKDKIDMDGQPTINGTMIYDLDLATMEEKPWQKPGADITDYFNYGFNEETWNSYCERQRKLRAEYGTQKEVNRAIVSSININFNPQQSQQQQIQSTANYQGSGRQLISVVGPEVPQKANKMQFDLSKPPPIINQQASQPVSSEPNTSPIEVEEENSLPSPTSVPVIDFSKPPPNFNPNVPPPDFSQRLGAIPSVNLSVQTPIFNQQTTRYTAFAGFNQQGQSQQFKDNGQMNVSGSAYNTSFDKHDSRERTHGDSVENSDDEYNRRKRRRRSRSGSPKRRKDDKNRDYRDSKSSSSSRKRRDDRDKRRDRDDDYDERKRRKYDRSERNERSERSEYKQRFKREPSPDADAPPGME